MLPAMLDEDKATRQYHIQSMFPCLMNVISHNMQDKCIHKFATKMCVPPPSTIKLIVGRKVIKTIQTTHATATPTKQREQQSIMHLTVV